MSANQKTLAEELSDEVPNQPQSPIDAWVEEWHTTLNAADKATWCDWLNDRSQSSTMMFRILRRKGFPYSDSGFDKWVRRQRDAR